MKVLLTTGYCNPYATITIKCDYTFYNDATHELRMYNKHGKKKTLFRVAIADDWQSIKIIDKGVEHIIK